MLNIKTERGEIHFEANGSIDELAADCCIILRSVYDTLYHKANEDTADIFKEIMKEIVSSADDVFVPW